MTVLYNCGLCCMVLSVWGFVQLLVMGILLKMEAFGFLDDVMEEEYDDYEDFINKTTANYKRVAVNCWIAAVIYVVMIGISYCCITEAKRKAAIEAEKLADEQTYCENKSKVI